MIKNLKKQFILITMTIVGIIIISIFVAICILTYSSQMEHTVDFLEQEASSPFNQLDNGLPNANKPQPMPPDKDFSFLPKIYTIKIFVDNYSNILGSDLKNESIDATQIEEAAKIALSKEKESGKIKSKGLIYLKKATQGGTIIVFTPSDSVDNALYDTVLICVILCMFSLLIFFILIERLSSYVIKPVKKSWELQKQFVADASHDLKTPITVILANSDILLSHKNDSIESQEKWIKSTEEEALKMKSLVGQMLDLAKAEAPSVNLPLEKESLSALTEAEILQLEPFAFEKQITFDTSIKENVIVNTNKDAYLRILQSLIDNAIKFSNQGSTIKVSLQDDKQRAVLLVNNQCYISEEKIKHIFERFYRADKSRAEGGNGLGLAIAKSLAIALGGDLGVKSSVEDGTTFALILKKKQKAVC
ncbi:MAG: HAMP domain-containing histidine kinase [Clostridia bacterium]|nr:HAMP domain-containing histidine kinase [Clostridia bacterium]